jgi:7-carboxy-7-deazaguanine synthase
VTGEALAARVPVHFSPVHGELDPAQLSAWILEDGLDVRLNLQLHKYIWGSDATGV